MGAEQSQEAAAKCEALMRNEPEESVCVHEDPTAVVMYDPSAMFDDPRKKRKSWQVLLECNKACKKRLVRTTRGAASIQLDEHQAEQVIELPREIYGEAKALLSTIACKTCSHIAANPSKLREHEIIHRIEKPFKCDSCDYSCKTRGNLTQHARRHSTDKSCKCDECDFVCTILRDLVAHKQRKHMAEKKYKCDECDYIGLRNCDLVAHQRRHTLEKPFKCETCPFTCSSRSGLIVHTRGHTGEKPYKCDECDYACVSSGNLTLHQRRHSGEPPHACDECEFTTASRSHLQRHKLGQHSGQKRYFCDSCDYVCDERHRLTQHNRKHTGEKPFKCDLCDYSCSARSVLTIHTRRHLKLKPHKCDSCEYTGATRQRLVEHLRTHTLEKPFKCDLCDYSCTSSGNLSRHKRKHTKPTDFSCPFQEHSSEKYNGQGLQCETFFKSATSLGFHIKERHDKAHVFKMPAELAVREELTLTFGDAMQHDWENYMSLGACESVGNSSYRFDFRTPAPEGFQMLVITEVDEFQHRRYPCDLKRMLHAGQILMQEFPDTPLVFLRWNPDPRKIGAVHFNVPFKERVKMLMRVLQNEAVLEDGKKMSDLVCQGLNVIYMFYDLERPDGELDSRVCMLNGVTDENADNASTVRKCVIAAM